jgi:hypothetical protein
LLIHNKSDKEEKMINLNLFTQSEEERVKQLQGIANLHLSIAKEIMTSDIPLSKAEMNSLLDLLITANEAKQLAQKLKTSIETKETA